MGFFDNLGDRAEHMGRGAVNGMANRGMSQVRNGIGGIFRRGADAVRDAFDGDDDDDDKKQSRDSKGKERKGSWLDRDGDGKTELFGDRDDDDDKKQSKGSKGKEKKGSWLDRDGDGKTEIFGEDNKGLQKVGEKFKEGVDKVKSAVTGRNDDDDDDKKQSKGSKGKEKKGSWLDRDGDGKTEIFGEDNKGLQKVGEKFKEGVDKVKSAVTGRDDDDNKHHGKQGKEKSHSGKPHWLDRDGDGKIELFGDRDDDKKSSKGKSGGHGRDPRDRNGDGEVSFGEKARAVMSGLVEKGAHMVEGAAHGAVNHGIAQAKSHAQGHGHGGGRHG